MLPITSLLGELIRMDYSQAAFVVPYRLANCPNGRTLFLVYHRWSTRHVHW